MPGFPFRVAVMLGSIGLVSLCIVGCQRSTPAPSVPIPSLSPTPPSYSALVPAGRQVYDSNHCNRCHTIGEDSGIAGGPMGKTKGPALTKVGSKRDREWIIQHVRNPKSHTEKSSMPRYDNRISDADMHALADYLAG